MTKPWTHSRTHLARRGPEHPPAVELVASDRGGLVETEGDGKGMSITMFSHRIWSGSRGCLRRS